MEESNEKNTENEISERQRKIAHFFKNKISLIVYAALFLLLWINLQIRTMPMRLLSATGKPGLWDIARDTWTLGPDLDPFLFLRYAKEIIETGAISVVDFMRYMPLGYRTAEETQLLPYMIAYLHKFINIFSSASIEYSAVIFPVVASVFMVIGFFLLVRRIFQQKGEKTANAIALVGTALLIVLPSLLTRTIAGIPEKESAGFGLMFFALYFFLCSWNAKSIRNAIILAVVAGASTGAMGLVWGGVTFVYASMVIAGLVAFIFEKVGIKELSSYGIWIFSSMIFWIPFTERVSMGDFLTSATTGGTIIVFFFMLTYYLISETRLKNISILNNEKIRRLPKTLTAIAISAAALVILASIFLGPRVIPRMAESVVEDLLRPYEDRLAFTVAENKQPFFTDWKESMGPVFKSIPLLFWLFFAGSILLLYELVKSLEKKETILIMVAYMYFLIALIFSRSSPSGIFNGENNISLLFYISGYAVLALAFGYLFYKRHKNNNFEVFRSFNFNYILVFGLAFIGIIAGRSAIRLVMILTAVATIAVAYLAVESIRKARNTKEDTAKVFAIVVAAIVVISTIYTFYVYYEVSKASAGAYIPSAYTWQWQNAMQWVRNSTPENAIFTHWWDYGYWIQSMGERATVLDGGNAISYWNHLMGRHVLTGTEENKALEFMYAHNVSYLLIDSTDIGKYPAYAMIGSDENYDRQSFIPTLIQDGKSTQETKNETIFVYRTGIGLDEDLIIKENGQEVFLPAGQAVIGAVLLHIKNSTEVSKAEAIAVYQGKQYSLKLKYVYFNDKLIKFEDGIESGVFVFPLLTLQGNGVQINNVGAMLYLSKRTVNSGVARYYLFGQESENIKLAHSEDAFVVKQLKVQGADINDFVFLNGQGFLGPIKIWKVSYPSNIATNPEYLKKEFPSEAIRVARK